MILFWPAVMAAIMKAVGAVSGAAKIVGGVTGITKAAGAVWGGLQAAATWAAPTVKAVGSGLIHGATGGSAGSATGFAGNLANVVGQSATGAASSALMAPRGASSASFGPTPAGAGTPLQTPGGGTLITDSLRNMNQAAGTGGVGDLYPPGTRPPDIYAGSEGIPTNMVGPTAGGDASVGAAPPSRDGPGDGPPGNDGQFWDEFKSFMLGAGKFAGQAALTNMAYGQKSSINFGPAARGPSGPQPPDYFGQATAGLFNLNQAAAVPSRRGLAAR